MPVKSDKFIWETYFILKAIHRGCAPDFVCQFEKNEVYVSAKLELNSPLEMAHLESRSLANQFREGCLKRLKKRYGAMFDLDIVECSTRENKTIRERIKTDSGKIKQRLSIGNTAPRSRALQQGMQICSETSLSQLMK